MNHFKVGDLKALLVDDDPVMHQIVEAVLHNCGFRHLDHASSANGAEEKMLAAHYDVVFLDWHMKGKSGVALMEQCREERRYDNVAFVIVSSESESRHVVEALRAGATSYIVKPVTEQVMEKHVTKIVSWLEKRVFGAEAAAGS
jgi:two-component system chemotaxis response regulator CheY